MSKLLKGKWIGILSSCILILLLFLASCGGTTKVKAPEADTTIYTYTGEDITYNLPVSTGYVVSNNVQRNAGTYTVVVSLASKKGFIWESTHTTEDLTYTFVINRQKVTKPTLSKTSYEYTGSDITIELPTSNKYTITGNVNKETGSYQALVALTDKNNYEWSDGSTTDLIFPYSISSSNLADATITGISESYVYNGNEIKPEPSITLNGGTLVKGTDYTVTYANNTNIGKATVTITGAGKYNGTVTKEFTITPLKITKPTADTTAFTYNENEQTYTIANSTYYTVTGNKQTNAGTYTVTVALANQNTTWDDDTKDNLTFSFVINKLDAVLTAPTANTLTYTGEAQALVAAGSTTGGELQYSLDRETYSTTIPTATNAGTYTVYYKVVGNDNYNGVDASSVTVTISKATPTFEAPTIKTLTYNGEALELITAGSISHGTIEYKLVDGTYSTTIPTATNAGSYTIYYKVQGDDNYNGVDEATLTVVIAKADSTITAPTANTLTYTGSAQALVNACSATGGELQYSLDGETYSTTIPTATNANTYTIYYKVVGNDNYNGIDASSVTATIAKKEIAKPTADTTSFTYDGTEKEVVIATASDYTITGNKQTNAGDYNVTITLADTANTKWTDSDDASFTIAFTILKAVVTVPTVETLTFTYTGSEITVDVPSSTLYTISGNKQTNAGTYTVTLTLADNNNYEFNKAASYEFIINPKSIEDAVITLTPEQSAYTGSALEPTVKVTLGETVLNATDYTITYSDNIEVGTAKVTVTATGNYTGTIEKTFQIKANNISDATVTLEYDTHDYTGNALKPTVTVVLNNDTLTLTTDYTVTYSDNTNAGTATITISGAGIYGGSTSKTFTINKVASSITTAPTSNTLTYTGSVQVLITAGTATGGTLQYKLNDGTYSENLPTATNAGTYTIKYKVIGDANHTDLDEVELTGGVTISKKEITKPTATTTSFTFDGTEKEVAITSSSYYTITGNKATNAGNYTVTITLTDTANTKWTDLDDASFTIAYSIAKRQVTKPTEDTTSFTYTGSELTYNIASSSYYTVTGNKQTNAGTHTVTITLSDTTNTIWADNTTAAIEFSFVIAKGQAVLTAPTANTLTYNGALQPLVTAGSTTLGTVVYKVDGEYTSTIPTKTIAGTYTVYYKVQGNDNFDGVAEAQIDVVISKLGITKPTASTTEFLYDGTAKTLTIPESPYYTISNNVETNAGDYTATVTLKYTMNTKWSDTDDASFTIAFSIGKITPTVTAPTVNTLTYTGSAQALITAGSTTGGTLQYKLNDGTYSTNIPEATNADTYTVYYKVVGNDNYKDVAEASVSVTITKKEITKPTATTTTFTYDGNEHEVVIATSSDYSVTDNKATNAGNYTATVTLTDTANTKWTDTSDAAFTIAYTIDKATPTVTAPTANTLTYTGSAQSLITAGSTSEGTMKYSLNGTDYSTDIPEATNADTYTIYYKVEGTANYADVAAQTVTVTISKMEITKPTATTTSFTYNKQEQTLTIAASSYYTVTDNKATNAGNYTATVTLTDTANTKWTDTSDASFTIAFSISKATPTVTAPTAKNPTYSGSAQSLINAGSTTGGELQYSLDDTNYSTTIPTKTDVDSYTVYYKVVGDSNYEDVASTSITAAILAKSLTNAVITFTDAKHYYTSNPLTPEFTAKLDGTTLVKDTDYTVAYSDNTLVGTAKVTITGIGNYTNTAEQTFTIEYLLYSITYTNVSGVTNPNPTQYHMETPTITLTDLTKNGYTFDGWTTDTVTTPTKNLTIEKGSTGAKSFTANWTIITYTITYNMDGGTNHTDNITSYTVDTNTFIIKDPTKTGFAFEGWTGTGLTTATKGGITITQGSTGNLEYTATWSQNTYNITYDVNGGTMPASYPETYTPADAVTLPTPTKDYYNFDGWYTSSSSTTKIETIPAGSSGHKSYIAKWNPISYTITYSDVEGIANSNPVSFTIETDTITLSDVSKNGYIFKGWTTASETTPTKGLKITKGTHENQSFTANWELEEYTITYTLNGGTVTPSNPTTYNIESETITLNNPTKDYYDFTGWTGSSSGETIKITKGSYGNKNYTANFTAKNYTITYELNGGTLSGTNPIKYNVEDSDITLNNPTKAGYIFTGWTGTGLASETTSVTISTGSNSDRTYTATFIAVPIALDTYDNTIGSVTKSHDLNGTNLELGNTITFTVSTIDSTYLWDGWYNGSTKITSTNTTDDVYVDSTTMILSMKLTNTSTVTTYTPKWIKNNVTTEREYTGLDSQTSQVTKYTNNNIPVTCGSINTVSTPSQINGYAVYTASIETGYIWDGWYNGDTKITSTTTTDNVYVDSTTKTLHVKISDSTAVTYTAKWYYNTITLTAEGGTGNGVVHISDNLTLNTYATITYDTVNNFTFNGWYIDSTEITTTDSTQDAYISGNNLMVKVTTTAATYTAHYVKDTIAITRYYINESGVETLVPEDGISTNLGNVYPGTATKTLGATNTTLSFTSNEGFTLQKVYLSTDATKTAITLTDNSFQVTNGTEATYIALWEPITYTITYENVTGATNNNPTSYTILSAAITLANASFADNSKTFGNWTLNTSSGTVITSIENGSTGNLTIHANWYLTLSFVTNGGNEMASETVIEGTALSSYVPTRENYTFGGWYTDATLATEITTMPNSNTTVYAHWSGETKAYNFMHSGNSITGLSLTNDLNTTDKFTFPKYINNVSITTINLNAFAGYKYQLPSTIQYVYYDYSPNNEITDSTIIATIGTNTTSGIYEYNGNKYYLEVSDSASAYVVISSSHESDAINKLKTLLSTPTQNETATFDNGSYKYTLTIGDDAIEDANNPYIEDMVVLLETIEDDGIYFYDETSNQFLYKNGSIYYCSVKLEEKDTSSSGTKTVYSVLEKKWKVTNPTATNNYILANPNDSTDTTTLTIE